MLYISKKTKKSDAVRLQHALDISTNRGISCGVLNSSLHQSIHVFARVRIL